MFDMVRAGYYYRLGQQAAIKYLEPRVGGLTNTSKMPWLSYSLPTSACKTGSVLRDVPGSVCSKCYACKGFYCMPVVAEAQQKRLDILLADVERWAGYMAALIERKASNITEAKRFFRWHDSGDIQSAEHFSALLWIASMVPTVKFYLPTKERKYKSRIPPSNLVLRHSMPMLRQGAPTVTVERWATVGSSWGHQCPASEAEEYKCNDCRACWSPDIPVINYTQH